MKTKTSTAAEPTVVPAGPPPKISGLFLGITVFCCGASVMLIEMSASRLIAPYYGTSLPVWTGLIGTLLAFLSLGYWLGGRLADRYPQTGPLYLLIGGAAIFTGLLPFFVGRVGVSRHRHVGSDSRPGHRAGLRVALRRPAGGGVHRQTGHHLRTAVGDLQLRVHHRHLSARPALYSHAGREEHLPGHRGHFGGDGDGRPSLFPVQKGRRRACAGLRPVDPADLRSQRRRQTDQRSGRGIRATASNYI